MNWIKLFILGLLLALSPFHLRTETYVFPYSLFGYGLILISFLFKKRKIKDVLLIVLVSGILVLALLNFFLWYYLLQTIFFAAVSLFYITENEEKIFEISSYVLIGLASCFTGLILGGALSVPFFGTIALGAPYFFISALIALFILDYKNIKSQ